MSQRLTSLAVKQKKTFQFSINAGKFKYKKVLDELSLRETQQYIRKEEPARSWVFRAEQCLLELIWWDTFGRDSWDNADQGHVPRAWRTGVTSFPKPSVLRGFLWSEPLGWKQCSAATGREP